MSLFVNYFYIDSTLYSDDGKERYASINHYGYNNSNVNNEDLAPVPAMLRVNG